MRMQNVSREKVLNSRRFKITKINKKAGKHGAFWQKESFDHIVRTPEQLKRIRKYIRGHSCGRRGFQPLEKKRQDAASTIWQPAAGTFDGWPEQLCNLKTLDPCCGSGHFLVAAFLMLVPMRMELEGLSAKEAVDAVCQDQGVRVQVQGESRLLREWRLHGKENDPTAFALQYLSLHGTIPGARDRVHQDLSVQVPLWWKHRLL